MAESSEKQMSVELRMEIFRSLVEAQDKELGTVRSRQFVAEKFGVSERDVRQIEEEGLQEEWPPL